MQVTLRSTIQTHFEHVARSQGLVLAELTDELRLADSGLDSLGFAILVARLDDELGVDPFGANGSSSIPITFGDFVQMYERAEP
ncbi:MAG: acyl carrier protein [Gemmatimonadaceae bacterium]